MFGFFSPLPSRVALRTLVRRSRTVIGPIRLPGVVSALQTLAVLSTAHPLGLTPLYGRPSQLAREPISACKVLKGLPVTMRRVPEFLDFASSASLRRVSYTGGTLTSFQLRVGRLRRGVGVTLSSVSEVTVGNGVFFSYSPILCLTTSLVSMAVGLPRRFRGGGVATGLLAAAVRRYAIITFGNTAPVLKLVGILPEFSALWSKLNRPAEEAFEHPITGELLLDTQLERPQAKPGLAEKVLSKFITEHRFPADLSSPLTEKERQACTAAAVFFYDSAAVSSRKTLVRYSLGWGFMFFVHTTLHGFRKAKRARSLKRRQTKKLVRRTQFRFWDL